ncbi:hypothetical protein DU000_07000 [Parvibium lacunae]|uniref:Uncharacterized protein n=1 Tax=Parvibium lacunae TaxID=1888893 RepID=A0A368L4P9_9BURK|nr:hypothetical protein DU000_07000 [Parvibium lacunae]
MVFLAALLSACHDKNASAHFVLGRWNAYEVSGQPLDKSPIINHTLEFDPNGELRVFSRERRYADEVVKQVGRWQIKESGTLYIKLSDHVYKTAIEKVEYRIKIQHDPTFPEFSEGPAQAESNLPTVVYVR